MDKPHRLLIDKTSGYVGEANAYLRRRRAARKPFARVYWRSGGGIALDRESGQGAALFDAAEELLDLGSEPERRG